MGRIDSWVVGKMVTIKEWFLVILHDKKEVFRNENVQRLNY